MKSKLVRTLLAAAFVCSLAALAQTSNAAAPPSPAAAAPSPAPASAGGTRVGTINIEQAIFASNEGQRDFEALNKKFEPKQNELKGMSDEVESLQKQLTTQGDKLNDDARASLVKQIEQKKKALDRAGQDAREDFQGQQNEIAQRILQKMAPIVVKYASDNAFGVIIDTSNPWPNGPVLWYGPSVDITKLIVEAYNLQSGVPAPPVPAPSASRPQVSRPAATTPKPAPPAPKPPASEPPK
jgi:outer membrane protein